MPSHLIYCSRATHPLDTGDLIVLLDVARSNNEARGVTGMLLYAEGTFLQLLEGPEAEVTEIFDRILSDPRHELLRVLFHEPVAEPQFTDWAMGFEDSEPAELARYLPGYVPPPELGELALDDADVARELLRDARTRESGRTALPVG